MKLVLSDINEEIFILDFDGNQGNLSIEIPSGTREANIIDSDNNIIWSGPIVTEKNKIALCVSSKGEESANEVISWKELPPFFSVFDGGYNSLDNNQIGLLLDDLITFHDLVSVKCHFEIDGQKHSIKGKWGEQEGLKELSEVLIDWSFNQTLKKDQLILLELELFETSYFVIGMNAESDEVGVVVGLTAHFYQQKNRVGRRVSVEALIIDDLNIIEVSDYGMKVSVVKGGRIGSNNIYVKFSSDVTIEFEVVYRRSEENCDILGLKRLNCEGQALTLWQKLLLKYQYPLLRYREEKDYQKIWALYKNAGYLTGELAIIFEKCKEEIDREWRFIDDHGTSIGTAVVGEDNGDIVASIGVTKAMGGLWSAQAAAVLDKPEYLSFTRAMYSWRTRYILQQKNSEYHLAFFLKDKIFLDRFFRKFYLKLSDVHRQKVIWEEWTFYSVIKGVSDLSEIETDYKTDEKRSINAVSIRDSRFVTLLKNSAAKEDVLTDENAFIIKARPYIHIAQYFSSAFISEKCELQKVVKEFNDINAFSLLCEKRLSISKIEELKALNLILIGGHEEVTWACPREYLSDFLTNSLKSLEVMTRKYAPKRVA